MHAWSERPCAAAVAAHASKAACRFSRTLPYADLHGEQQRAGRRDSLSRGLIVSTGSEQLRPRRQPSPAPLRDERASSERRGRPISSSNNDAVNAHGGLCLLGILLRLWLRTAVCGLRREGHKGRSTGCQLGMHVAGPPAYGRPRGLLGACVLRLHVYSVLSGVSTVFRSHGQSRSLTALVVRWRAFNAKVKGPLTWPRCQECRNGVSVRSIF